MGMWVLIKKVKKVIRASKGKSTSVNASMHLFLLSEAVFMVEISISELILR